MKIIHVVTLISPDAAYGGPVRVALNLARELIEAGHDVTVVAGSRGFRGIQPTEFDGIPVLLFPVRQMPRSGFAGLHSPGMRRWLRSAVLTADVVHVHLARDLITLPAAKIAQRAGIPVVAQTHGMIVRSSRWLARPLDAILTKPILKAASAVLYLDSHEKGNLDELEFAGMRLKHLQNGVPEAQTILQKRKVEVLFLARLHPRKRPMAFVSMAKSLVGQFPSVSFALVGPDEGEGRKVSASIGPQEAGSANINWEGSLRPELTAARMNRSSIYVLPSINEPFPMSVLEAMALGLPVIVTDSCGLASAVTAGQCGIVVNDSIEELTAAVATLLSDEDLRKRMGNNARSYASANFGMKKILATLSSIYSDAIR